MLPYTVIVYIIAEYLLFIILMDHFQLHREQAPGEMTKKRK